MIKTKLVTLTPTDSFFFGGEQTFGKGEGRNFYAESRYFPQQTSIVGLIRHALFEAGQQAHFGKSFVVGVTNDFGWLKGTSPIFIQHETKSMGLPMRLVEDDIPKSEATTNTQIDFGNGFQDAVIVEGYIEKTGTKDQIVFEDGSKEDYDAIFRKVIKTGIARDRKEHTTIEGMFYRQLFYRMKAGYSFAVYVTGDEQLFPILEGRNMPFGGEKVNFVLTVQEEGIFSSDFLRKSMTDDQIVLTSDAYVSESIYKQCALAMADTLSFRNIVTPTNSYSARLDKKKNESYRYKSGKFTLLKRGAVLFPKGNTAYQAIIEALENKQFKDIGYNHFYSNFKTT